MQPCQLTYHLLEKFSVATPGVDLQRLEMENYPSLAVLTRVEELQLAGLMDVVVAYDKLRKPYSGAIVGLTQAGTALLAKMQQDYCWGD
jgi:hypothetical protein